MRNEIWIYKLNKDFLDFKTLEVDKTPKDLYELLFSLTKLKNVLKMTQNIYDLYNLQKLDLSENELTEIPKEIGNLLNLQ